MIQFTQDTLPKSVTELTEIITKETEPMTREFVADLILLTTEREFMTRCGYIYNPDNNTYVKRGRAI